MEHNPGNSEVEKVEVMIQTCMKDKKGSVIGRNKRTFMLDPRLFAMHEMQQTDGKLKKVGKPYLSVTGSVIGGQNEPLD